jgi:hypothetical protein
MRNKLQGIRPTKDDLILVGIVVAIIVFVYLSTATSALDPCDIKNPYFFMGEVTVFSDHVTLNSFHPTPYPLELGEYYQINHEGFWTALIKLHKIDDDGATLRYDFRDVDGPSYRCKAFVPQ